jgi:hypothetical protein
MVIHQLKIKSNDFYIINFCIYWKNENGEKMVHMYVLIKQSFHSVLMKHIINKCMHFY